METEIHSESKMQAMGLDQKGLNLEKGGVFEAKKPPSKVIDGGSPDGESRESVVDTVTPLRWGSSFRSDSGSNGEVYDLDSSPRTPKFDVFDPFAPGREEKLLAPQVKKIPKEVKISISRRLSFGEMEEEEEKEGLGLESPLQDEILLETMYESILDVIVSSQAESVVDGDIVDGDIVDEEMGVCEKVVPNTPTKIPFLTGIAETCPSAPKKARSNSRHVMDMGLRRKLEF